MEKKILLTQREKEETGKGALPNNIVILSNSTRGKAGQVGKKKTKERKTDRVI